MHMRMFCKCGSSDNHLTQCWQVWQNEVQDEKLDCKTHGNMKTFGVRYHENRGECVCEIIFRNTMGCTKVWWISRLTALGTSPIYVLKCITILTAIPCVNKSYTVILTFYTYQVFIFPSGRLLHIWWMIVQGPPGKHSRFSGKCYETISLFWEFEAKWKWHM